MPQGLDPFAGGPVKYVNKSVVTSAYHQRPPFCKCYLFGVCFCRVRIIRSNAHAVLHLMQAESVYGIVDDKIIASWINSSASTELRVSIGYRTQKNSHHSSNSFRHENCAIFSMECMAKILRKQSPPPLLISYISPSNIPKTRTSVPWKQTARGIVVGSSTLKTLVMVCEVPTDQTWTRLSRVPVMSRRFIVQQLIAMTSWPDPIRLATISSNSLVAAVEFCFQTKRYPSPVPQQSISLPSSLQASHATQVMGSRGFRVWLGLRISVLFLRSHNFSPSKPVNSKCATPDRELLLTSACKERTAGGNS